MENNADLLENAGAGGAATRATSGGMTMRAEIRDFALREIGCIACRMDGRGCVPCEKHHLLTTGRHGNGKRRGERYTIGLCPYHHRGVGSPVDYRSPSLAREPRAFRAKYGEDDALLAMQDRLIAAWEANNVGAAA